MSIGAAVSLQVVASPRTLWSVDCGRVDCGLTQAAGPPCSSAVARDGRDGYRVVLWHMQDERELTIEHERERRGTVIAPPRLTLGDLQPDTLRAVIESFVLREGTDYGVHETSLG